MARLNSILFLIIVIAILVAIPVVWQMLKSDSNVAEGPFRVNYGSTGALPGDVPFERHPVDEFFTVEKIVDASNEVFDVNIAVGSPLINGMAFAPDGRLFYTELSGSIKVLKGWQVSEFAFISNASIAIRENGEAGLFDITLDPDFEQNHYVYVYYLSNGTNRIARFTDENGVGTDFTIIFEKIPQGFQHNGGVLKFGLDGKLYLSTGDGLIDGERFGERNPAQNVSSLQGKILRMNSDGSMPDDNPFAGTYTFAYGLRNPFGYDIHPVTGKFFVSDNGIDCCDELTIMESGNNSGWPFELGITNSEEYKQPIYAWSASERVAPTRLAFYNSTDLYMGTWRTRELYHFILDGEQVKEVHSYVLGDLPQDLVTGAHGGIVHEGSDPRGGILDVEAGPDGFLYISDADGIYRLKPK